MAATTTPEFRDFLPTWLSAQRWYVGPPGATPVLERIGGLRFADPAGEVGIETWLLRDTAGERPVLYQVPLSYRGAPLPGAEDALLAQVRHSEHGMRWVYDAAHDPVAARVLLDTVLGEATVVSDDLSGTGRATGHRTRGGGALLDDAGTPQLDEPRVLRGEQSNTSIIFDGRGPAPSVICKLFRVLTPGDNPDVLVPEALATAGSSQVPAPVGSLAGRWPEGNREVSGYLLSAQEFVPGVEDAWRVALRAADTAEDFTQQAQSMGEAVARVHTTLATVFPTAPAEPEQRQAIVESWRRRAGGAIREVPELAEHRAAIATLLDEAAAVAWPALQRVHGDLHLGQVVHEDSRGWLLLDFEGEPLRPLAERSAPDLALRDVAGMLRSIDYAAGQSARPAWGTDVRRAFLHGYARASGQDPAGSAVLLRALELDKALYEVVYEARNRPGWLHLPLSAVPAILAAAPAPRGAATSTGTPPVTVTPTDRPDHLRPIARRSLDDDDYRPGDARGADVGHDRMEE